MALLHRVRRPGGRGLRPASPTLAILAALALFLVPGCTDAPGELQPPTILQDSLGLTVQDRVHVVRLEHAAGAERAVPDSLAIRPGDWVDFVGGDGRVRMVSFLRDSMRTAPRDFLQGSGVTDSPPLLGVDVHWAVPFEGAPAGRYPFVVTGSGGDGRGVVVVEPRR